MTIQEVLKRIGESKGKIFSIRFTKRSTGEARHMVARTDVTSYLKGGPRSYDFEEKGLICVFDMQKKDYRTIPVDAITKFKSDGEWQKVTYQENQ